MANCLICKKPLDVPGQPETTSCGGDCRKCMAFIAGDDDEKHNLTQDFAEQFKALYQRFFGGYTESLDYEDLRTRCQDCTSLYSPWMNS